MSGFARPVLISTELADFFAIASVGPLVEGQFVTRISEPGGKTRMVPVNESLVATNQPLNIILYFTQRQINGQVNPLYRVIDRGHLTPLFALHSFYTGMATEISRTRLSASLQMRQMLSNLMYKVIISDLDDILTKYPYLSDEVRDEINAVQAQMIANITQPQVTNEDHSDDGKVYDESGQVIGEIFNPNSFIYANFSKLIAAGIEANIDWSNISDVDMDVQRIYSSLMTTSPVEYVLEIQRLRIDLARAYKNQQQSTILQSRRATRVPMTPTTPSSYSSTPSSSWSSGPSPFQTPIQNSVIGRPISLRSRSSRSSTSSSTSTPISSSSSGLSTLQNSVQSGITLPAVTNTGPLSTQMV